ncbi:hypothetical protein SAMN02745753_03732 [Marinomonas polaris DSM 16579]|uniref:Uncharacterized protein n=1 Tax=Marinomonas polaris DSM 16579 TaxID=1122206 RepID=A0A1M5J0M1_9GAMM|nr:hypothetical protein [Marinomonas polaris]SHG34092.1 hypothetical protein SAMN02745753_03732 [Marinomonas polaris DSM 16579]
MAWPTFTVDVTQNSNQIKVYGPVPASQLPAGFEAIINGIGNLEVSYGTAVMYDGSNNPYSHLYLARPYKGLTASNIEMVVKPTGSQFNDVVGIFQNASNLLNSTMAGFRQFVEGTSPVSFQPLDENAEPISIKPLLQMNQEAQAAVNQAISAFQNAAGTAAGYDVSESKDDTDTNRLSKRGDSLFTSKNTYKLFSSLNSIPYDENCWNRIGNTVGFLTNSNNSMAFLVGGALNDRKGGIQCGHSSFSYSNALSELHLNPFGGNVLINSYRALHAGNTGSIVTEDYEEGTWTPRFTSTINNPNVGYSEQHGTYVKTGRLVYVTGRITLNSVTDIGSGSLIISGLPVAFVTGVGKQPFGIVSRLFGTETDISLLGGVSVSPILSDGMYLYPLRNTISGSAQVIRVEEVLKAGMSISFTLSYPVI